MERYIGLDVHAQSCVLAVVGLSGKRLKSQRTEFSFTFQLVCSVGTISAQVASGRSASSERTHRSTCVRSPASRSQ